MLILFPAATCHEVRHVSMTERNSLVQTVSINISTTVSRLTTSCGTGSSRFAYNLARGRIANYGWASVGKQWRKVALSRVARTVRPKVCTNVKACEPNVPSAVGKIDKGGPVVDPNLSPADDPSHVLAAGPDGGYTWVCFTNTGAWRVASNAIVYRDLPLGARHTHFGSEPRLLSRQPDASHDITTFEPSRELLFPPTSAQPESWVEPLGQLDVSPARVTGAQPFPTAGFDLLGAGIGDAGQWLEPRSQPYMGRLYSPLAMDSENYYNARVGNLVRPPSFVSVKRWEVATRVSSGDVAWLVEEGRKISVACLETIVMFRPEVPRLTTLNDRDATAFDTSPSPMFGSLYGAHQGWSLCALLATNRTHTAIPVASLFHFGFPYRYIPCKFTEQFVGAGSTVVRRSTIAQLLKRFIPAPAALPLPWFVARCLSTRWCLGDLPGALVLGVFFVSTLSWNPNTSAGSSRFSHAPDSGQASGGTYPNLGGGGGMGSDSKVIVEPPYLAAHGDQGNLFDTEGPFGEGTVDLPSLSYDHIGVPVPQRRDFIPATPIPLNTYALQEWSQVGEHDYEDSSAPAPIQRWPMIAPNEPIDRWGDPYHSAPVPSDLPTQSDAFQPKLHDVPDGFAQSADIPGQSANPLHANGSFQIPNASQIVQPEPQVHGFDPDSNSTLASPAHTTEWTQPGWQHSHNDCHSAPGDSVSSCVTDAVLAGPSSSTHTAPAPHVAPKLKPSSKTSRGGHTCHLCGRSFRRPYLLKDHMTSRHKQGQLHRCDYPGCTLEFTSRSNLRRHYSEKHQDTDDSHANLHSIQSFDEVQSWVGSGGIANVDPRSSVIVQHLAQDPVAPDGSALPGETILVQQSVPGSSAPSTTGLPYLDFLLANVDSSEDGVWAQRGSWG